jgi:DNA-binding Xre family transcriptional regulator
MNNFEVNKYILQNYIDYFRPRFDEIEDIQEINKCEILIIKKDGSRYIFNDVMSSIRRLPADPDDMTDEQVVFEFMQRFRSMRILRAYNISDLHELTGISMSTLSRYDNGETTPTVINLRKLAKALKCGLSDLILMEYE